MLVSFLEQFDPNDEKHAVTLAVALFDIGEFAKYFAFGRSYLDKLLVKPKIYTLMQKSNNPEIKK